MYKNQHKSILLIDGAYYEIGSRTYFKDRRRYLARFFLTASPLQLV